MMKNMLNVEKNNPNLHEHQPRRSIEKKHNKIQATKKKKKKKSSHTFLPPEPKENNQLNSHIYCPRHKK
jgi:hypothetical protein